MSKKKAKDLSADESMRRIFGREVAYELKRIAKGKPVKARTKKKAK